jgi:hypothetical protein
MKLLRLINIYLDINTRLINKYNRNDLVNKSHYIRFICSKMKRVAQWPLVKTVTMLVACYDTTQHRQLY